MAAGGPAVEGAALPAAVTIGRRGAAAGDMITADAADSTTERNTSTVVEPAAAEAAAVEGAPEEAAPPEEAATATRRVLANNFYKPAYHPTVFFYFPAQDFI